MTHLLAAAEGKVWQKFDCEVLRKTIGGPGGAAGAAAAAAGGGGGSGGPAKVVLDPEYRKLSRQRHEAAAVKTRTVQYLQDTKLVGAPTTVQASGGVQCQPWLAVVHSAGGCGGMLILYWRLAAVIKLSPAMPLPLPNTRPDAVLAAPSAALPVSCCRLARSGKRCLRSGTAWMLAS
jgi:hypothetical protein